MCVLFKRLNKIDPSLDVIKRRGEARTRSCREYSDYDDLEALGILEEVCAGKTIVKLIDARAACLPL